MIVSTYIILILNTIVYTKSLHDHNNYYIGCQDHNLSHPYPYNNIILVYARIMIVILLFSWSYLIHPYTMQSINKQIGLSDIQKFQAALDHVIGWPYRILSNLLWNSLNFAVDYQNWEQFWGRTQMSYTCLATNGISISQQILQMLVRFTIAFAGKF